MIKQDIINKINSEKSDYKHSSQAEDQANSLDTISDDIYSESERFVYELIQNADDASISGQSDLEIQIEFTPNFVVISHNGRAFNERDINAISSVGRSQKSEDPNQTGYKGIGFKSVFGKSDCVYISSDGYCFRYDKNHWAEHPHKLPWQIIPVWSDDHIPTEIQQTKFGKYPVSTAIQFNATKGFKEHELREILINLFRNAQVILFLRNVALIKIGDDFSIQRTKALISEKKLTPTETFRLSEMSIRSNAEESNWLIGEFIGIELDEKTKTALKQDDKAPKRLKETQFTNISFAGKINHKRELIGIKESSLIFTYLPTKINKNLPFLINADFITNAPREGFHEDRFWNIWLFEKVGYKLVEWLREIGTTEFKYQISELIADIFSSGKEMEMAFNKGYRNALKNIAFIPNIDDKPLLVEGALIEKTGILRVINTDVLINYYNAKYRTNFKTESIVNNNIKSLSSLENLGVKSFEVKNLKDFFTSDELCNSLKISDNIKVIKFFYKKVSDKKNGDYWKRYISEITFIANQEEKLCTPSDIYFPVDDFEISLNQDFDFVHHDVVEKIEEKPEIKEWLQEMGVEVPTSASIITKSILPNLTNLSSNTEKSVETVRYLFDNQKNISDFSIFGELQLVTTQGYLKRADTCYLSDFYKPELALEQYLPYESFFVSHNYARKDDSIKEWNLFFTRIGVVEKFYWQRYKIAKAAISHRRDFSYFSQFVGLMDNDSRYSNRGEYKYELKNFYVYHYSFLDKVRTLDFSKLFWNHIFQDYRADYVTRDFIEGLSGFFPKTHYMTAVERSNRHTTRFDSYFIWTIKNLHLFPTLSGELKKANEVLIQRPEFKKIGGSSLPVLDLDVELPPIVEQDTAVFNFRKKIHLNEYLQVLSDISCSGSLASGVVAETTERIGLIYRDLLGFTSTNERREIAQWAESNELLSTNNTFIECSKLHFLNITQYELPSEVKGFIKIPYEVKNQLGLIDLLACLGVKIINQNSLLTRKENPSPESDLQMRVEAHLPLIALVVAAQDNREYGSALNYLKSVLSQARFFKAEALFLDCIVENEPIFTKQKTALSEGHDFYYTGTWNSPVTLYDLTSALCEFLKIKDISKELNVLLLISFKDGMEWLQNQKYDISQIPSQIQDTDRSYTVDFRNEAQKADSENMGEIAEKFVFNELVRRFKAKYSQEEVQVETSSIFKTSSITILWHRALGDRYENRDITITELGIEKYIEVKATKDTEQTDSTLFLSYNEWSLMKSSADRYYVARVFNGTNPTEITYIKMETVRLAE